MHQGSRLKALRDSRGLSQEALAKRVGTTQAYISQLEAEPPRRLKWPGRAIANAIERETRELGDAILATDWDETDASEDSSPVQEAQAS